MEHRLEQDERLEEKPEAEVLTASGSARAEEASAGMEPTAGTMELEQQHTEDVSTATRYTEVLTLPKVDRGAASATPAVRPGDTSTPCDREESCKERGEAQQASREVCWKD